MYSSTQSLNSVLLDRGEWSASLSGRYTLRERDPDTYWIGGWVGPRAGLDVVVKKKIPSPCRDTIFQPVAQHYTTSIKIILGHIDPMLSELCCPGSRYRVQGIF
jgi:hypothetical protein